MITAVDTNVLLDVLIPGSAHFAESGAKLDDALAAGAVVASEPVVAELAPRFPSRDVLVRFLRDTRVQYIPASLAALDSAGQAWAMYTRRRTAGLECPSCGRRNRPTCGGCGRQLRARQHIVADFLIGAHALVHAERLLTRDRGFFRTYFPELTLA